MSGPSVCAATSNSRSASAVGGAGERGVAGVGGLHLRPRRSGRIVHASRVGLVEEDAGELGWRERLTLHLPNGSTVGPPSDGVNADSSRMCARILRMDATDRRILSLLMEDGRRTYDDIAGRVKLSAPSVKRRVDRLRASGALRGYTAVVDHAALGWNTEALVELFYRAGDARWTRSRATLREHPEVVEAWSVTGEADAIARVRTEDNADLERLIIDLQRNGLVSGRARRWCCRGWWGGSARGASGGRGPRSRWCRGTGSGRGGWRRWRGPGRGLGGARGWGDRR